MKDKRVVFMGTPEFSVPVLEMLIENTNVVMVVTQPDAYTGRHHELTFSPVKKVALEHNIKVFQPEKIRKEYEEILNEKPDVITVDVYPGIADLLLLRMKRLGIDIPVIGGGVVISLNDKTLGEGSWCVDDGAPSQDFISKMGTENTLYGEFIYTQLQIIANAFENTPAKSGEKPDMLAVSKTLRKKTAEMGSPFGTIDVNDKGEIYVPAVYKTIHNGKVELLTE